MNRLGLLVLLAGCSSNETMAQPDLSVPAEPDLSVVHDLSAMRDLAGADFSGDFAMAMEDMAQAVDQASAHKRVFVTSATYKGDLKGTSADGLAGADQKCKDAAMAASL